MELGLASYIKIGFMNRNYHMTSIILLFYLVVGVYYCTYRELNTMSLI